MNIPPLYTSLIWSEIYIERRSPPPLSTFDYNSVQYLPEN